MGKFLIKIGKGLVKFNWIMKCKFNKLISKLLFDLSKCPVEGCECKK